MTDSEKELLAGILAMGDQAAEIGLCALPFAVIYDKVTEIIAERDALLNGGNADAND